MAMIMVNQLIELGLFVAIVCLFRTKIGADFGSFEHNFAKAALHEPRNWPQIKS